MSLISCQRLHIAFGGPPLLENASLRIERGGRVGLLGRNGEGKSILMKIPMGSVTPDEGEVIQDAGTRASCSENYGLRLPAGLPVLSRARRQPVGSLSGDERNRLLLARLFTRPANVREDQRRRAQG